MGKTRTPEEVAERKAKKEKQKAAKRAASEAPAPAKSPRPESCASFHREGADTHEKKRPRLEAVSHDGHSRRLTDRLNPKKACFDADLKARWSTMSSEDKQKLLTADRAASASAKIAPPELPKELPFQADPNDHCETSPAAYSDVAPLLELVADRLCKARAALRIYDPYYCSGAVKRHLAALGFTNVYNKCEDFYAAIDEQRVPDHDVVVTNPPYSEDPNGGANHVAKLLAFLKSNRRPFLLNMPEYVASASYFKKRFSKRPAPLLLCPRKRYHFWSPVGARSERNPGAHRLPHLGVRSAPFVALWYVALKPLASHDELCELACSGKLQGIAGAPRAGADGGGAGEANASHADGGARCWLCRDIQELPDGRHLFKRIGAS